MRYPELLPMSSPDWGDLLPIERISPRPSLHRLREPGSLQELAEKIRRQGLIHPVTVRAAENGRFIIVSGNRRLMACRMLGLSCIAACVLEDAAAGKDAQELLETLQSGRLHYLQEAEVMSALHERHGLSRGELAARLGRHPQLVTDQLRLADLGEELTSLLLEEGVPMGAALTLLRLQGEESRIRAACRIARERLCIRDAALLVEAMRTHQPRGSETSVEAEEKKTEQISQNHTGRVINAVRDHRIYFNAIRAVAGQMQAAGLDAAITEQRVGSRMEVTVSLSLRRRRSARYHAR